MANQLDIISFQAGQISELMADSATVGTLPNACRELANLVPTPQGPAVSRPPGAYLSNTKGNGDTRFIKFVYSQTVKYALEFGDETLRFYTEAGQLMDGGDPYEIATVFTAAEIWDIQVKVWGPYAYIVHPDHYPQRLTRNDDATWTIAAYPAVWGPFLDANDVSTLTITPSATTGTITLTASAALFDADHVGAIFQIGHRKPEAAITDTFVADGNSPNLNVPKGVQWRYNTSGTWTGTLILEKSYDAGTSWEAIETKSIDGDTILTGNGTEVYGAAVYRFRLTGLTSGSLTYTFSTFNYIHYGYALITVVTTNVLATATVTQTLGGTAASYIWSEGAWSAHRGYPTAVGVVEGRLTFMASAYLPTTMWLSRSNDFADMEIDVDDPSAALIFTFNAVKNDPFLWILGESTYYLGTAGKILRIAATNPSAAISADNPLAIQKSIAFKCSAVFPLEIDGTVVVLDKHGKNPCYLSYFYENDILLPISLVWRAPGICGGGIVSWDYQETPIPVIWAVRADGKMLSCTFKQIGQETVSAWAVHTWTAGLVKDVLVTPGTNQDRVIVNIERTVDGSTVRHVEQLVEQDIETITREDFHMLDGHISFAGESDVVEGITVGSVDHKVTIAATGHPFSDGDQVRFRDVGGATWLNNNICTVADKTANAFILKTATASKYVDGRYIDGDYTTGGTIDQVANAYAGLDHWKAETVTAVADGIVIEDLTVASGGITLPAYYHTVHVGVAYTASLEPLRLVLPFQVGSSRGRKHKIDAMYVSFYRTWEFAIGVLNEAGTVDYLNVGFTEASDLTPDVPDLKSGDRIVTINSGFAHNPRVFVRQLKPLGIIIRAIGIDFEVGGTVRKVN
jgi:hypothetical protein